MSNIYYLIINVLLYFLLFVSVKSKKGIRFRLITVVTSLYFLMSIVSLLLFYNPLSSFNELKLFPFIYLFLCLVICFSPLIRFDESRMRNFEIPSKSILNIIVLISILVAFIGSIDTLTSLSSLSEILINVSAINDSYNESRESISSVYGFSIFRTLGYLFNDLYILFLFLYLSIENKTKFDKFIICSLSISLVLSILGNLISGIRGPIVSMLFCLIFMYIVFQVRLNDSLRVRLKRIIISVILIASLAFAIITLGRFGKDSYNASIGMTTAYSLEYYAGQQFLNFNNYALNAGGTREGDKTFPIIRKALGYETSNNWAERREKYSHMKIDDSVFYTFVGDFTLDFGPFSAVLVLIVISALNNTLINKINKRGINFFQLILVYILYIICTQGFTLYPYSEFGGNRTLLFMIIIGAVLSIKRY